jgi:hypothetical protein
MDRIKIPKTRWMSTHKVTDDKQLASRLKNNKYVAEKNSLTSMDAAVKPSIIFSVD